MDNFGASFIKFVQDFCPAQKRSMFGGLGLFSNNAMFALVTDGCIYIRGGGSLDEKFESLSCKRYRHKKKQTTATVNYFDVSELYAKQHKELNQLLRDSIEHAVKEKEFQKSTDNRRLRDLPNMQLTLERMVKKAGIHDVSMFLEMEPTDIYQRVQEAYGKDVDIKLLWKFAGAIEGVHWTLIQEPAKQELLSNCEIETTL